MAHYTYKLVAHRDDFQAAIPEWIELENDGCEPDGDSNYNGDNWRIAQFLLNAKDKQIVELQADNERLRGALTKANEQAEYFEREWFLRGDQLEERTAERDELLAGARRTRNLLSSRLYDAASNCICDAIAKYEGEKHDAK